MQIAGNRHQLFAKRQKFEMIAQVLADDPTNFIGMGDDFVERAILCQPFKRGFRAAFGNPRHAIDGITNQRQIINDLARRYTELGLDTGLIKQFVAHRVVPAHQWTDQLSQILVTRRNKGVYAGDRSLRRQRADHVIRLNAIDHQYWPAGRRDRRVDRFDLLDQILRHRRPVRLVGGEPVIAKSCTLRV